MRRSMDSWGTSPLIGLISALVVFSLVFAVVFEFSIKSGNDQARTEEVNLSALASDLANLMFLSSGRGWYQDGACSSAALDSAKFQPDQVSRFGLAEEACKFSANEQGNVNNISYDKLLTLMGAKTDKNASNKLVDYAESRSSLGLDRLGLDFHLRTWPLLPSVAEILRTGYKDPNLRVLYIGDYEKQNGPNPVNPSVQHAKGVADGSSAATPWVNVTNNGTTSTMFSVRFTVPAKKEIVVEEHTPLIAPGASFNVTFALNKTSDWTWKDNNDKRFDYLIRGVSQTLGQGTVSMSAITMTLPNPPSSNLRKILTVEMDQLVWVKTGGTVNVSATYDALAGDGATNVNYNGWSLEIRNSTDALVTSSSSLSNNGGSKTFALSALGGYRMVLKGASTWRAQEDFFSVVASSPVGFTPSGGSGQWVPQAPVAAEAGFADFLIEKFDNGVFDPAYANVSVPYVAGGDIVPDDNKVLADQLPLWLRNATGAGTVANYNAIIVGSDVDHNSLTSGNIKLPIRDWVQAGGNLIVLGSLDQSVTWLEPLFHVAIDTAGGGISVPDENHPLLKTPNSLDYLGYDNHGLSWKFKQDDDAEHFTHVVKAGSNDLLAVSNPGEFGKGRIILTSWQSYDMVAGPESGCTPGAYSTACQGLALIDNLITLSYQGLYVDYGPPIPDSSPLGIQSRILTVYHPELQSAVELHAVIYVFH